jgi:hypothetical protein
MNAPGKAYGRMLARFAHNIGAPKRAAGHSFSFSVAPQNASDRQGISRRRRIAPSSIWGNPGFFLEAIFNTR